MLKPPLCQWQPERHGEMHLHKETEAFWTFVCECGCIRAISKPSIKAAQAHERAQQQIEHLRQRERILGSRPSYSLPSTFSKFETRN